MRRTFRGLALIVAVPVALIVAGYLGFRSWRESIPEVYRLCGRCGFAREQVDTLISDARRVPMTDAAMRSLFENAYGDSRRGCWTACAAAIESAIHDRSTR